MINEVNPESRRPKGGGYIEKFSFSKLSCFEQCKYQYYMKYVLPKKLRPKEKENSFSQYGSFVHKILERFQRGEITQKEMAEIYRDEFDIYVSEKFPKSFVDLYTSYYTSGLSFLQNYCGQPDKYEVLDVEMGFETDIGGHIYRGIIDLPLRDKNTNQIIIQDWKSKSSIKTKADKKKAMVQLYTYSKPIYEKYGEYPDMLRLFLFRKNLPVDQKFIKEEYDAAQQWIIDTVNDISACKKWDEYSYDEFFCSNLCGFRDSCKYKELVEFDNQ